MLKIFNSVNKITILAKLFSVFFLLGISAFADQEGRPKLYVESSQHRSYYAKGIPGEYDFKNRSNGKTQIFKVEETEDTLLFTYNWYAGKVYLLDREGVPLVRLGPWPRGDKPSKDDLAIGFYINGETIKEYSTLDIVDTAYENWMNIFQTASHYAVFEEIIGFRQVGFSKKRVFDVKTYEGKTLSFDIATGKMQSQQDEKIDKLIETIYGLKMEWYSLNTDGTDQTSYDYRLTFQELKEWGKDRIPEIPKGYTVDLGDSIYDDVRLEVNN